MNLRRSALVGITAICVSAPIVSYGVRLALNMDLTVPLQMAVSFIPPLAAVWLWHLRNWSGLAWVEVTAYTILLAVAASVVSVNILGAFYLIPFIGVFYQDWRICAYGALTSVVAVWLLVFAGLQQHAGALGAQLTAQTFLLVSCTVMYSQVIALLRKQEQALLAERSAAQVRQIEQMAKQWALTVEARSSYTGGHTRRVTEYAMLLAPYVPNLGMDLQTFELACTLHDVGKIAVPDGVLNKPGSLSAEEWRDMRSHTVTGYDLALRSGASPQIAEVVRHHHERWDGSGYPDSLGGPSISMAARVLAVADAFDAMTSHRPYRPAMSPEQALQEIVRGEGTQFDPVVVQAFRKVYPQWADLSRQQASSTA